MDQKKILKEACVESIQEALCAQERGADRIELCASLDVGGLTPSNDMIEEAKRRLHIPVMVMIRPRGGNFIYNRQEIRDMQASIDFCRKTSVAGIVFGFLNLKNSIDIDLTYNMALYGYPLEITFHKAIDATPDPVREVKALKKIKEIKRILTSGGAATALEGARVIRRMILAAGNSATIIAAGKITRENLAEISGLIPTGEFHGRKIVGPLD